MKYHNEVVLTTLLNADAFRDRYAGLLGPAATASSWDKLKEVIADLSGLAAEQVHRGKQAEHGTATKADLRFTLRKYHMEPVWMIARAKLLDIPMSKLSKFDVPPATASDVSLIAAAQGMATVANEFRQVFLDLNLPATFVEDLNAAATALRNAIVERDGDRLQSRRARLGADTQVHTARELLRILTAMVVTTLVKHPEVVAEWKSAIRIRRKPGVARGATVGAGGTTPTPQLTGAAASVIGGEADPTRKVA